MEFELKEIIKMIENMLRRHPNRSDYKDLVKLKKEMKKELDKINTAKCDFCDKPCGKDWCSTKESK